MPSFVLPDESIKSLTHYKNISMPCSYTNRIGVAISVVSLYRFNLHFLLKLFRLFFYCCFIAVILMHLDVYAETGPSVKKSNTRHYDIPAGPLNTVLTRFISEAGIFFAGSTELAKGRHSSGVRGNLSIRKALDTLLIGTDLEAIRNTQGQYMLRPANAQTLTLPAMTISAEAEKDALPPPYAGGQVARGGRLGMLGNKDVMDTPFNITNYTSQLIEDQQAATVLDVLKNEPSVRQRSASGGGYSYFNIRGFDVSASEVTFDGLPGMAPGYADLPMEFAERIEVLKGPSALLYGMSPNGRVGGAVNLVPKRADDKPLTRLTLGVESDALWKSHVDVGRRFGANGEWGLRFNGSYSDGDGYVDDQKKGGHVGALALDYRGERLRMTLDTFRLREKIRGGVPMLVSVAPGRPGSSNSNWLTSMPAPPDPRTNLFPDSPGNTATTEAVILGGEYDFNSYWTGYAKLGVQRYKGGEYASISPSAVQLNGDATILPEPFSYKGDTKSTEAGLRGRFQTGAVSHALALSASYLTRDAGNAWITGSAHPTNIYAPVPIVGLPILSDHIPKTSESTLSGIALADTLGFMDDRVLLTLGVRRQNVKSTNFNASTGVVTSGYDASTWSPMAGLVVKPTEYLSLYANYIQGLSQGTRVGQNYLNAGEVFPPYKTEQVEAGAKLQTGSFTNTISLFQITRPSTLTDDSTSPLPTLRLDGEQRNRGIEWTVFGELMDGLRVLGGITYTQAKLTKTQGGLQDGNQAFGSPPWAANFGVDWDVPGLPGLALNGWAIHTSRQYVDNANSLKMPSWTRLDLGARYATQLSGKPLFTAGGLSPWALRAPSACQPPSISESSETMRAHTFTRRDHAALAGRILLAVCGGYAFCWGVVALFAAMTFLLGAEFHDGEMLGLILALLFYPVAFLWSFAARSLWLVSGVLVGGGGLMAAAASLIQSALT